LRSNRGVTARESASGAGVDWNETRQPGLCPRKAGASMTDYRPRNDDLLYNGHERTEDGLRVAAIFGSITVAVALLVTTYLIDVYNPASTGFTAAIPARAQVAQQATPPPAWSLAASAHSGSPF
jgi:hypothetical protein